MDRVRVTSNVLVAVGRPRRLPARGQPRLQQAGCWAITCAGTTAPQ